ncbi:unnamed protein product [Thelazia callipaeda]|uniref:Metalloendopeptidase n=1 Tax=Thelazia callipaeda TaxID=103827 RepID=A0A0N5CQ16_THECL|nr:unnamed protein product [Thelazia callipaeda]
MTRIHVFFQNFVRLGAYIGSELLKAQNKAVEPKQSIIPVRPKKPKLKQSTTTTVWPLKFWTQPVAKQHTYGDVEDYDLIVDEFAQSSRDSGYSRSGSKPTTRLQSAPLISNEVVAQSFSFGQEVIGLLSEIAQYSDAHQKQNQDYGSVQKLLSAFFTAVSKAPKDIRQQKQHLYFVNDGTEMGRNRAIAKDLFESDIVLTVEQLKGIVMAEKEHHNFHHRFKRKVITGAVYRWPKNRKIPYEFTNSDENWRKAIRSSLAFWERETCVRWEENGVGFDRLIFFRGSGYVQIIGHTIVIRALAELADVRNYQLATAVKMQSGIIAHEIGHSLGFWHEQSRPDRDQYIKLRPEYIARGTEGNFIKRSDLESESMGLPFDLGSVMHYGPTAFSIDWNHATIETIDKRYDHTIGQRYGPSFIDIKQVNRLYCNDRCPASSLACENGGYPDPNNCQICKCPTGLGGLVCSDVQPSACGGELYATIAWQQLAHKGSQNCYWRIRADDARIRIKIQSTNFQCDKTCHSYIEIKHNSDFQQTGFRVWYDYYCSYKTFYNHYFCNVLIQI